MSCNLYKDWLSAFESVGINAISKDTAARILAVTYVHGNNEALVHNQKYVLEIKHIQKMFGIEGGGTPPPEMVDLIKEYVRELEQYANDHDNDNDKGEAIFKTHAPEWAHKLFQDRYGIKLIN